VLSPSEPPIAACSARSSSISPLRLRRHLRARTSGRRPARLPARRARAGARARPHDHALPRRQLRVGLQLGGRRGPDRPEAAAARPRLDVDRAQHLRNQRVHRLVPGGGRRADAGGQPRDARAGRRAQPGRVLQPTRAAPRSQTCAAPTAGSDRTA
jgi:hypothetical protein